MRVRICENITKINECRCKSVKDINKKRKSANYHICKTMSYMEKKKFSK